MVWCFDRQRIPWCIAWGNLWSQAIRIVTCQVQLSSWFQNVLWGGGYEPEPQLLIIECCSQIPPTVHFFTTPHLPWLFYSFCSSPSLGLLGVVGTLGSILPMFWIQVHWRKGNLGAQPCPGRLGTLCQSLEVRIEHTWPCLLLQPCAWWSCYTSLGWVSNEQPFILSSAVARTWSNPHDWWTPWWGERFP